MIFYDFEVFKYDWMVVIADTDTAEEYAIINDKEKLATLYENRKDTIWVGYNSQFYDQYILKGILLGMDPKEINDFIIVQGNDGWQYSDLFRSISLINYDCMPSPPVGLKVLEGFMGANIKETDIPFDIDRKLTEEELALTEKYCRHDVEQTYQVFLESISNFEAMMAIVSEFQLPPEDIGLTEARITAKVLGCQRKRYEDELDYYILPCIKLKKYKYVQDWFENAVQNAYEEMDRLYKDPATSSIERWKYDTSDIENVKRYLYSQKLKVEVAGVPHIFAFGGLHGAPEEPLHLSEKDGAGYHVDVNNYYPSFLIAHDDVTRSATNDNYTLVYRKRKDLKDRQLSAATKEEAKMYKKMQLPYKKMLNALSGAMKDPRCAAYDPRNNNIMCINGQLMLLDLIEHLEVIPGFKLVQSNTDGLIIWLPDTDEAFQQMDDICYEWECRCSTEKCTIGLALDTIKEIYQKDVNNYLWIEWDGGTERKGAYVKALSRLDNDLPIVNKAVVEYMVNGTSPAITIYNETDFTQFQKIVKLSSKYKWVEHEETSGNVKYDYKSYRVFASLDPKDGRLLKCKGGSIKPAKFANTPDQCFICNDATDGMEIPEKLDRSWYLALAEKRLKDFGIKRER